MTSVEEDKTGTANIHVWDAFINQIKSGTSYEIENLTVKQFQGITHVGANFSFCFRFLTLTSYRVLFFFALSDILLITLLYYVLYVNLVIVCYLVHFLPELQVSISVTLFVAVDFFSSVSLTTKPCYPQHLVSGFVFIVFFNFVLRWPLRSSSVL